STGTLTGTPTITGITGLNTTISQLLSGVTYNWSVRSRNGAATSDWSAVQTFTTVNNAAIAATPVLSWPVGGVTVYTNSPTLSWFLNSASTGLTYELKYSTSPSLTGAAVIPGLTRTQYILENLVPGTTYYWSVRSFDGTVYSTPSVTGKFVIFAGNYAVTPVPGSPADGVEITDNEPVLSWYLPTSGDVESYTVEYSAYPDMAMAVSNNVTASTLTIKEVPGTEVFWRVQSKNSKGEVSAFSEIEKFVKSPATGIGQSDNAVTVYSLKQNFPNPFNPSTTIAYEIPRQSHVELIVYDMLGRAAAVLVSKDQSAGSYKVQFDASSLPSGVYIYKIHAGEFMASKKLLLIK
ncbi:MAG: T9SS type A sorting domain-containing protein, partial [Methanococcaceae archaeon]